ncbi:MAG TPA: transketolase [Anaerolineales bacterium]|nr:transketolase [Anaerolineales bacterium]
MYRITTSKTALDEFHHGREIEQLKLAAIVHRRKLLELGHRLQIRLHYGATMSSVEILSLLYLRWMQIDPQNTTWPERDRFVLSKGHAAPALYVALWMSGFFPEREFDNFRRLHSILQGHPDRNKTPGVECTTGSLGQGFPTACGMALGAAIDNAQYRVYTLISDGECNEGSTWEAALIAANQKLDRLTVLLDWNKKSSYGPMAGRNDVEPLAEKWRSFGWAVFECDGHDYISLSNALASAHQISGRPSILLCQTVKGKGIPYAENNPTRSNFALTEDQYLEAMAYLETQEKALQYEPAS